MAFLTVKSARNKIPYTKSSDVFATITFNPPKVDANARPPLDIAVALDTSGSMHETGSPNPFAYVTGFNGYSSRSQPTSKLQAAKDAIAKLVEHLSPNDTLSLVTFDNYPRKIFTALQMDEVGKKNALHYLAIVQSDGQTALADGLVFAVDAATRATKRRQNSLARIMLFTDGQANIGAVSSALILNILETRFAGSKYGISTFGFGHNHNADLLASLTRDGNFYFIDDPEKIATAFGTELGSLTSLYATDVTLRILPGYFIESIEVVNDLKTTKFGEKGLEIVCDNLLAEQPYTVILKMKTLASHKKPPVDDRRILDVAASLKDLRLDADINLSAELRAEFTTQRQADKIDDPEVAKAVAVQTAAKAQKEAMKAADRGDMSFARSTLNDAAVYAASVGHTDIEQVLRTQVSSGYASSTAYKSGGQSMSASLQNSFSKQTAGTGGQTLGGVDIDNMFANPVQKATAKTFSIKVKRT